MSKEKDNDFWTEEKKQFLVQAAQQYPALWQNVNKVEAERQFNEVAEKLGTTNIECHRYFTLLQSKYIRHKKKLASGKKIKNNWPYFEDFQRMEVSLQVTTKEEPKQMDVSPQKQIIKGNDGSYDNVGFTSGSSEDEEEFPTQSHVTATPCMNPRKRPYSPGTADKVSIFRKAGEYMIAELENMQPDKAELLLNKTLKFFVDHRYD